MRELISVKSQLSTLRSKARGADYMREIGSLPDLAKIYFFPLRFSFTKIHFQRAVREAKAISNLSYKIKKP